MSERAIPRGTPDRLVLTLARIVREISERKASEAAEREGRRASMVVMPKVPEDRDAIAS